MKKKTEKEKQKKITKKNVDQEPKRKKKTKSKKIEDKKIRILRYIIYALVAIFVVEGIYFGIRVYINRKNTTYYSALNSAIEDDDKIIAVGFGDSKHSKFIKYKNPGYNKPYIWIYDKDLKIENEIKLEIGYNGVFNDIVKVDDGYIVVGYIEMTEENNKNSLTEATIVKYDKEFNIVWRKNLDILGNTKFKAVKVLDDGNIYVVGTSVYPNDIIGNHTTGGAIIVKYNSKGEKQSVINYGGPRSGTFNDFILEKDGIVAVGVRSSGTGIILKYSYDGKELWHNYYGYTDSEGITSITKLNDNEYVATATKLDNKDKTDTYKAALLKFDKNGKLLTEKFYQKSKITKFEDSLLLDDKLYVIGIYGQKIDSSLDNDSVLVTYSKDLTQEEEKVYEGNKTYTLNKLVLFDDSYILIGHTDSKIKKLKTNGLDYYPVIVKDL